MGSGIGFAPRGSHELKGVPGEWQLLAVGGEDDEGEEQLAEIDIGSRRSGQKTTDRAAAAVARRAPGAIRAAMRLDPRYRRSVKDS